MNGKAPYKGTEVKMRKPIVAVTADTLLAEMKPINQKMADYAPRPLIDALGRNGFLPVIRKGGFHDCHEVPCHRARLLSGIPR